MASLNHVCIWSEKGWKRITAKEASSGHPDRGGVSYRSGLFRCDLCGQYVGLTKKGKYVSHFRHSDDELSKDCPDRTDGSTTRWLGYDALVLGAFGCGAFRNDAAVVSDLFAQAMRTFQFGDHATDQCFRSIDFAVLDHTPSQYNFT